MKTKSKSKQKASSSSGRNGSRNSSNDNRRNHKSSTATKKPNHQSRRRRLDKKNSSFFLFSQLPLDLFESIFSFLCWQEIFPTRLTCKQWNQVILAQSKQDFEWKNTFFTAENASIGLEKIRVNTKGFLNTRFPPSFLVFMINSSCAKAFNHGKWWIDALNILENEQKLPKQCAVLCLFSSFGVVGTDNEEPFEVEEAQRPAFVQLQDKQIRLSITCAHLPDTKVDFVSFDRKTLRREADTLENPFASHPDHQSSSFLLFSSNSSSAEILLPLLRTWSPTNDVVVGGVLPFQDRCQPIAYSSSSTTDSTNRNGRYTTRHDKTHGRQVEFGTNVVVRLIGRVGIKPFCSSGFEIMSPVLQKCPAQIPPDRHHHLPYEADYLEYDRVLYQNEVHYLADLLRDHTIGSVSFPLEGVEETFFNIYSSSSKQILEKLVHKDYNQLKTYNHDDDTTIERIEMVSYSSLLGFFSLDTQWRDNMYGVFALENATSARKAYQQSLVRLKQEKEQDGHHFLGAFLVICCLKGQHLYREPSVESHIFHQIFPTLPISGCFSGAEIGPVSLPDGYFVSSKYQVQSNTTCGAMFYYQ